jgi:hypothetical protein
MRISTSAGAAVVSRRRGRTVRVLETTSAHVVVPVQVMFLATIVALLVVTFALQSMVLEYVTDRLVQTIGDEVERGQPLLLLVQRPLIMAQSKDNVRETQERLIGAPIVQRLDVQHGEREAERRLLALLDGWRGRPTAQQGFGPGNIVNLLRVLRVNCEGWISRGSSICRGWTRRTPAWLAPGWARP